MATVEEMRSKLRASQDQVEAKLASVPVEQMELPVPRRQQPANVRAMFYRLYTHEVEHTTQMIKTLAALGLAQSEAQLILRKIWTSQGELEGLLAGLSDEDLNRTPSEGEWSPCQVLEHIIKVHETYTGQILGAFQ